MTKYKVTILHQYVQTCYVEAEHPTEAFNIVNGTDNGKGESVVVNWEVLPIED